jgi:glycine cleavage system H protein
MEVPGDRHYTDEHEWVLVEADGTVRVGITDYAQDALGDVVFVELPDAGKEAAKGATLAEVESTKSVGEVYSPVKGTVADSNQKLIEQPDLINSDPYGEGWIMLISVEGEFDASGFLDTDAYRALTE